jgi:hypothetical protein
MQHPDLLLARGTSMMNVVLFSTTCFGAWNLNFPKSSRLAAHMWHFGQSTLWAVLHLFLNWYRCYCRNMVGGTGEGMWSSKFCHCSYSIINLVSSQSSDRDSMAQIWWVLQYHKLLQYFATVLRTIFSNCAAIHAFGWISTAQSRSDGWDCLLQYSLYSCLRTPIPDEARFRCKCTPKN